MVSDNIVNYSTSSNNDALSNMTSMDIDNIVMQVLKNEYISCISVEFSNTPSLLFTTELGVSNKTNNPDNNTDI